MTKELIPPDIEQCQAEKPNGNTFMTLGGQPGFERCTSKPTWVAYENCIVKDGKRGSMSLCDHCKAKMITQCGCDFATFERIYSTDDLIRVAKITNDPLYKWASEKIQELEKEIEKEKKSGF